MSLKEVQNFLAQVYTDEDLRRAFLSEPQKVGRESGLSEIEAAELTRVLPEELNFFADSLFYKRLREVEKLLPLTKESLGKEFEIYFREFANRFTSQVIKKHLTDAVEFCKFLQLKDVEPDWIKDAAKFEGAKLEFWGFNRRMVFRIFDYDLKTKQKRKNFGFWVRVGKRRFVF